MLKYYKQEIRDLRDPSSEKTRTVYKVKFERSDTAEQFADYFARHSSLGPGMSQAALIDLVRCLLDRLAEVGSVSVPELGTFSVAVRSKKYKKPEPPAITIGDAEPEAEDDGSEASINARSIAVDHVNFRCNKQFLRKVQSRCNGQGKFQLVGGRTGVQIQKPRIAKRRERFAAACDYLAEHHFMYIADYAELTGLSYSSAQRELRLAATLDHSGIVATGSRTHRFYILAPNRNVSE